MAKGNGDMTRPDPAIPAAEIARTRAQQLVGNISGASIERLSQMRDQLDDLMRAVRARDEKITDIIAEHAAFADQSIKVVAVVGETLSKLVSEMNDATPKLMLGATVTDRKDAP
jgi:ABC-type transporter Mla subunit MlaD